jgi:CRP-like cAMP-binding protein
VRPRTQASLGLPALPSPPIRLSPRSSCDYSRLTAGQPLRRAVVYARAHRRRKQSAKSKHDKGLPCLFKTIMTTPDPQQNHLLAALPQAERERLFRHLKLVTLPLGKVLYESGDLLQHIYFPTDSIVSLLYVLKDGGSAEIAVVGNDGAIGVALFMGGETTTNRAIVQSGGSAFRLTGARLKEEFGRHGEMLHILLRYTQALLTQMAQTAVCNRHHSVDQQLCRWLLLSLDRLPSSELAMTQELIANMLGVRREGVTEAAGKLQKLGVIRYRRGRITVLNRPRLEQLSCECYAVVKEETDRLMPLHLRRGVSAEPLHISRLG